MKNTPNQISPAPCWICKAEEGTTGEHSIKQSDIKSVLGAKGPFYLHNDKRRNNKIQSITSVKIKSKAPMCNTCNSARTQPHDKAWKTLSEYIRCRNINPGDILRANRVFTNDTTKQMRNVHLWFVKWLGCQIVETDIPIYPGIDIFSRSIMQEKSHPNIWLAFGCAEGKSVGVSDIDAASFNSQNGYDYICRFYYVGTLAVRVRFSTVKLKDDWHPSNRNRLVITDFL
jgi:hypothetical protein